MRLLLQTKNLHYANLLSYPDLTIVSGQVTFIIGASGSGKSTLLKLFNAALSPSAGTIFYCGRDISELDTINLRREVSLVSQEVFLFSGDIRDNFRQFYQYRHWPCLNDEEIKRFLRLCCLSLPLNKAVDTMSGGERQRLYIAIFLSFMPRVLMLDEPTAALDKVTGRQMLLNIIEFMKENKRDLLIVCHDPQLVEELAETVIKIQGGVI